MPIRNLIPLSLRRTVGGWWDSRQARLRKNRLLRSLRGDSVQCNVCGWTGAKFTDDCWHPGTICPNCRSQVRHRLLASLLDGQTAASEYSESNLIAGRRVLHFAPERQLRDRIKASSSLYVTADYERGDCDLQLNMSAMPSVSDASFDILIACDVLEHVPDDRQAIHEIRRILKPGGTAILTVPQADPPAATDEDPSVTDPAERESRFGQKDHLRIYGEDFAGRLQREHFLVKVITADSFPMETIRKHVLFPPALSPHRLATNHRRIYLASPNES